MDDLYNMLGIKPKSKQKEVIDIEEIESTPHWTSDEAEEASSLSESVLSLDEWDMCKGLDLFKENNYGGKLTPIALADFHNSFFSMDPEFTEKPINKFREKFLKELFEQPDYKALHQSTQLDALASKIAAHKFAKAFAETIKDKPPTPLSESRPGRKGKKGQSEEEQRFKAICNALEEAQEEVDQAKEFGSACGLGDGIDGKINGEEVVKLFDRVKNSERLRAIFELSGKLRMVARSKQRHKVKHGQTDLVGVTMGNDIAKLLPSELGLMGSTGLQLDTLRRLVDKQCLSKEYKGVEPVGKGPIAILVDESGSMSGRRIAEAKAFALAMAWIAMHQKRWCRLISFSSQYQVRDLVLIPGKWDQAQLLTWLEGFFCGDTVVPLKWMQDNWQGPKGKTDIICLSDGDCHIDNARGFNEWKVREKVRMATLIIGAYHAGSMKQVSDEVYMVKSISLNEQGVENCLSI